VAIFAVILGQTN
jgi:drug/metabolite transporter (DMT)-like permease